MNKTLTYYDENASAFSATTLSVSFSAVQDRFLSFLPESASILDFGCGSGRDAKYFLSKGYSVDATDGSARLCEIASRNAGIKVRQMLFYELDADAKYDGIWACASILHLPKTDLGAVMEKMIRAVKPGGTIYVSFKYGEFEGDRDGRYFTDFTTDSFHSFVDAYSNIRIMEEWISADVRPGREDEKWLNVILRRSEGI